MRTITRYHRTLGHGSPPGIPLALLQNGAVSGSLGVRLNTCFLPTREQQLVSCILGCTILLCQVSDHINIDLVDP